MTASFTPSTIASCAEVVRDTPHVVPVGAETKPRLSDVGSAYTRLSTLQLRGVVEYEPDEYTITVLAGTPLREIAAILHRHGQYLPFDPLLVEAGSTVGGAIAAGASGPGRLRFGGIRDFILGIRFIDGEGRILRMGGKVVKNAAGFDLPKFFVGSLGRYGVLVEASLKVFPRRPLSSTLQLALRSIPDSFAILLEAAKARWELDAIDLPPDGQICLRLSAPEPALRIMAEQVLKRWPGTELEPVAAAELWTGLRELRWAHPRGVLAKLAITPAQIHELTHLTAQLSQARVHISAAGNVAFISLPASGEISKLDQTFRAGGFTALTWIGPAPLSLGARPEMGLALSVKNALDPAGRFPPPAFAPAPDSWPSTPRSNARDF